MRILNNGRANTVSEPVNVYKIDHPTVTMAVNGNFAGAMVTIQYSADKVHWTDVVNAVDLIEPTTGTTYSITGWFRVQIEGGVAYKDPAPKPFVWRCGIAYNKDTIVNIDGKYYISTKDHIDGSVPTWEFYAPYDYQEEEIDNSGATDICVDFM